ncbi:unnamed protein product [Brassica rapa subsp. narinosa]
MGSNSESVSTVMGSTNFAGLFGHVLICVSRFGCLRSSHFCSKHKTKISITCLTLAFPSFVIVRPGTCR